MNDINEIYKRAEEKFPQVVEYFTRPYDSYNPDLAKEEYAQIGGFNDFYEWYRKQPEVIEWENKKQALLNKRNECYAD